MRMSCDTIDMLRGFATGSLAPGAFDEFLVSAADDDRLSAAERAALLSLRMTAIECGEGEVPGGQLRQEVLGLLASCDTTVTTSNAASFIDVSPAATARVEITTQAPVPA